MDSVISGLQTKLQNLKVAQHEHRDAQAPHPANGCELLEETSAGGETTTTTADFKSVLTKFSASASESNDAKNEKGKQKFLPKKEEEEGIQLVNGREEFSLQNYDLPPNEIDRRRIGSAAPAAATPKLM